MKPSFRSLCDITTHYKAEYEVIMLHAVDVDDATLSDGAELVFNSSFTNGYDVGYDIGKNSAKKGAPTLFTINNGRAFMINKMAVPEENTQVLLGFYAEENNKKYRIESPILPAGWRVYLEDKMTGAWHDLTLGAYNFTNNSMYKIERFVLHFSTKSEPIAKPISGVAAWGTQAGIELQFSNPGSLHAEVLVTNLLGQVLHATKTASTASNYVISIANQNPQMYMVTIVTAEQTQTIKVVR